MSRSLSQNARRRAWVPIFTLFLLITSLIPVSGSAAAAQGEGLPPEVLQASVRFQIAIEVIPEERGEDPFLCEYPQGGVIEYGNGSGTIISEDGYILTNHHVVEESDMPREISNYCEDQADGDADVEFTILAWTPNERGVPTDAYRTDLIEDSSQADDLAVVKITEHADGSRLDTDSDPFPYVQFGDSDSLREPEKITMIGYPANAGVNRRVSEGIFSGWGDNGYGIEWIYTDATISGGNSGGTAINGDGLFIGIPSAMTADDCRPGDTNQDGVIDEDDGCIGLGGNYALLIPSNLAREFAEEATGLEFDVVESGTPVETPEVEPTSEPVDPDTPLIEDIEFIGTDDDGTPIEDMTDLRRLEACFDSAIPDSAILVVTWFLNGEEYFVTELEWQDTYNPNGCVSIFLTDQATIPFLEAGTYTTEIEVEGETYTSGEVDVFRSSSESGVEVINIRGRTTDGDTVSIDDDVLEGEFSSLTATIRFAGMEDNMAWQADLYFEGDLLTSSDAEVWHGDDSGAESVRLIPEDDVFDPGDYELVITIDGDEEHSESFTIED